MHIGAHVFLYAENAVNGILAIAIERKRKQRDKIETVEN